MGKDRWKDEVSIIVCGRGRLPGQITITELGRDGSGASWEGTSWQVTESLSAEDRGWG